jgi:hypothetical protein
VAGRRLWQRFGWGWLLEAAVAARGGEEASGWLNRRQPVVPRQVEGGVAQSAYVPQQQRAGGQVLSSVGIDQLAAALGKPFPTGVHGQVGVSVNQPGEDIAACWRQLLGVVPRLESHAPADDPEVDRPIAIRQDDRIEMVSAHSRRSLMPD